MAKKKSLELFKNWNRIFVAVNDLELDPQNVRLDLTTSERSKIDQGSIIIDLFDNENAFQILESVAENGLFIDETPIVIKKDGKFIVLEGNRRIAALKVLQNPLLAPSHHAKVKPISDSVIPIKNIEVLLAPNRKDADNLLANKHTKPTTRPWKPLRQAHFYYSQLSKKTTVDDLKKKYKGVDIEKFIRMAEVHKIAASYDFGDIETNNKVREQRSFPVSTVERLYDDQKFREHLNFEFNKNGEIQINSSQNKFDEAFKTVILDSINKKIDTRTLGTENARKNYYSKFKKLIKSSKKTKSSVYIPHTPIKRKKTNSTRLFDKSLVCTLNSKGIERVLHELQTIDYEKFPNAAHDLMRSFLEAVLKEYLKKKGSPVTPKRPGGYIFFYNALRAAEDYFKANHNHQIRQVVTDIIKDKELFDCINHNPSIFSTGEKAKVAADQMSDLIKFIFMDCK